MKHAVITDSFRKRLKALRRHFSEGDVIEDMKRFAVSGFRRGECELKKETFDDIEISVVKLRIRVRSAVGRYLVAVVGEDFSPLFIDLKTGRYGKNMSFSAEKNIVSMLQNAFEKVLLDYLEHADDEPRLTRYPMG
jgi:hypothetical protein